MAIALGLFAAVSVLAVWGGERFSYRAGDHVPKLYSRVAFGCPNPAESEANRDAAAQKAPSVYVADAALPAEIDGQLKALPAKVKDIADPNEIPEDLRRQFGFTTLDDLAPFAAFAVEGQAARWESAVDEMLGRLAAGVILSREDFDRESDRRAPQVLLVGSDGEQTYEDIRHVTATHEAPLIEQMLQRAVHPMDPAVRDRVRGYVAALIAGGRPTYRLDPARTTEVIEAARAAVVEVMDPYTPDEVIFSGGRLTAADLPVLRAEYEAYRRYLERSDPYHTIRAAGGRFATALGVVLALCAYISLYRRRIVTNHVRGIALAVLIVLMLALAKAMVDFARWPAYVAVAPAAMGAMIFTIAYDRRFALATGSLLAVMLTLQMRQDVGVLLTLAAPVMVSAVMLHEIRTRSKLIEVGAAAAVAAFAMAAVTQLAAGRPVDGALLVDCGAAGMAAMAVGFFAQGILPLIEKVFGIATSMTLLEWCDANKKLLKRLAIEAPGTYNHSLQLGTLCEAAAERIGARGLLARVGAYYHDIGKINKPEYFIENQFDSPSKHAKLSPAMSLLIITGHVKDGIEMAREYGLPRVLHEFIAAHHGTTLVQYFYHAATEQRKAEGADRAPDEVEFRYPGPKPRSKEAAILMLADAVESSVRAMSDPTPGRIETQAHAIVMARLMDGQLDECDMTLREVHQIEESLVKSVCGVYHGRIAYPKTETPAKPKRAAAPSESA